MRILDAYLGSVLIRYRWWDLRSREVTKTISYPDQITSMELSLQTQRLVLTSGKTVEFIPALPHTGHATHTVTLKYAPSSASIHPILQDRFVTGSMTDEWVRVHGINGEERDVLKGHHGPVHCVEFSPDGEMYASGSGEFLRYSVRWFKGIHLDLDFRGWHDSIVADDPWQDLWIMARNEWALIPPSQKI